MPGFEIQDTYPAADSPSHCGASPMGIWKSCEARRRRRGIGQFTPLIQHANNNKIILFNFQPRENLTGSSPERYVTKDFY